MIWCVYLCKSTLNAGAPLKGIYVFNTLMSYIAKSLVLNDENKRMKAGISFFFHFFFLCLSCLIISD